MEVGVWGGKEKADCAALDGGKRANRKTAARRPEHARIVALLRGDTHVGPDICRKKTPVNPVGSIPRAAARIGGRHMQHGWPMRLGQWCQHVEPANANRERGDGIIGPCKIFWYR